MFRKEIVGKFEKVTFYQFKKDLTETNPVYKTVPDGVIKYIYDRIKLPCRATSDSAGYDFHTPIRIELKPKQTITIPTGICCEIREGWFLGMYPRSGLGFKYRLQLDNTIGIIDGDYYYAENEGHIMAKITNDSYEDKEVFLEFGDRFMQGVFQPYGLAIDDNITMKGTRIGGFGSTG